MSSSLTSFAVGFQSLDQGLTQIETKRVHDFRYCSARPPRYTVIRHSSLTWRLVHIIRATSQRTFERERQSRFLPPAQQFSKQLRLSSYGSSDLQPSKPSIRSNLIHLMNDKSNIDESSPVPGPIHHEIDSFLLDICSILTRIDFCIVSD